MGKFARSAERMPARGPIRTLPDVATTTFEGSLARARDAKGDLFMLAVVNMSGEDTFYEGGSDRDARFRTLVHQVAIEDFNWLARFAKFLRTEMFMRSASIVLAAEGVKARLEARKPGAEKLHGTPVLTNRQMIDSVIARMDEPAEMLAYWASRYGRNYPTPVKRGVADAIVRLTNEYSAMKYDGTAGAWRLGDVIDLVHPIPKEPWQSDLFAYLLDRRHHASEIRANLERLPKVLRRRALEGISPELRRALLRGGDASLLDGAGATWEWLSGWLPGGMDREAWEAVIPSMGYMALLRNLRNFDEEGVSDEVADYVVETLKDPVQVAMSMQFPFRFWSAYRASAGSLRWGRALSQALDLATLNVPVFTGRTLVLVDSSGSMSGRVSAKSVIRFSEVAAVFGAAVARRNAGRVDLVHFASGAQQIPFKANESVITLVDRLDRLNGVVGHGTDVNAGLRFFDGHDRVIVFSDMQLARYARWPEQARTYCWNIAGYAGSLDYSGRVVELGGYSDKMFRLVPLLERGTDADWPF